MNWIILIVAGFCEVGFTFSLGKAKEATEKSTEYLWYGMFLLFLITSMALLIKATQHLPLGTAYAVWTGIGAVGTVLMGIFFFKEPINFWRLFFISTLIASIVGLKYVSSQG
ncbi:DMT family transporter [Vaginella massiliensis]|uniref:DMT family transporter n=1 Tax=Vaginella massiliensis TaxID=1816680 RepID=UPI0008395EC1|nr:multidrug efflux SMR transporter [Vaginella massiliensis]